MQARAAVTWVALAVELQRDWAREETVADVIEILLTERLHASFLPCALDALHKQSERTLLYLFVKKLPTGQRI